MSVIHRPMPNGDCTCGKYLAGDWEGHKDDLLVLDPDAAWNSKPLSNFEFAVRPFVEQYIEPLKEIGKALRKMSESLKPSMRASRRFQEEYTVVKTQILEDQARCKHRRIFTTGTRASNDKTTQCLDCGASFPGAATFNDDNLPGMWTTSDFMGGDPDERSYAQRCRDGDHFYRNFRTLNEGLQAKCVRCGAKPRG